MKPPVKAFVFAVAAAILSVSVVAQDIPLQNWAPAPWQPGRSGKIATNATSTAFMAMAPCRVYDSRSSSALPGLSSRAINVDGGPCSGIPSGASAYSINITVFGSTSSGSYEFVTAYPTGSPRPDVSTLNFLTGTQTSNAATIPAGTAGDIDIYTTYTTHFVLDINGYYSANQNLYDGFVSSSPSGVAVSGTSGSSVGVEGVSTSFYGVRGSSTSYIGVEGSSMSSYGVFGSSSSSYGVRGSTGGGDGTAAVFGSSWYARGVVGSSLYTYGVSAESAYSDGFAAHGGRDGAYATGPRTGVVGSSTGTSGPLFGVIGTADSPDDGSAGVLGRVDAPMAWATSSSVRSGVRGDGKLAGVIGFSENIGVAGIRANADGTSRVEGYLGWGAYGMYAIGNTAATGTKSFVEPHATDPHKVIKYVSLEGPEAGTYFRGRATLSGKRAVIEVPEDFRMVTDSEGLTVHLTPIGGLAILAVVSADLNEIVVESNRDVEFSYLVYGVREAFRDFEPIQLEGGEFMPTSPDSRMPSGLPAKTQRRLVETGVYNEDGSVNLDTAERLGWTKIWRDHSRPQEQ